MLISLAVSAAVFVSLVFAYARFIEPRWLRVRYVDISVDGSLARLDGLRVLHLSDLHVGRSDRLLRGFIETAAGLDHDVAVITGDFVENPGSVDRLEWVLTPLCRSPDRQVIGILGNHDRYRYPHRWERRSASPFDPDLVISAVQRLGVEMLVDRHATVETRVGPVTFAGLDIKSHSRRGLQALVDGADAGALLLLAHSPDVFSAASKLGVRIVLAGHTHGGQVRIGPWFTPKTATLFPIDPPSGLFQRVGAWMHVSPGLGTTLLPLRFFARPEATVLHFRAATTLEKGSVG